MQMHYSTNTDTKASANSINNVNRNDRGDSLGHISFMLSNYRSYSAMCVCVSILQKKNDNFFLNAFNFNYKAASQ